MPPADYTHKAFKDHITNEAVSHNIQAVDGPFKDLTTLYINVFLYVNMSVDK